MDCFDFFYWIIVSVIFIIFYHFISHYLQLEIIRAFVGIFESFFIALVRVFKQQ